MWKLLSIFLVLLLFSCKHDRLKVKTSDIDLTLNLKRYDQLIFDSNEADLIPTLKENYDTDSLFVNLYFEDILQIGNISNDDFPEYLNLFVSDSVYSEVADTLLAVFNNFKPIKKELTKAFKHYKYYFPEKNIPIIYTYMSGFNQALMLANDFVGIGLDLYLGSECLFYQYLGIPRFKIQKMYPLKIVTDLFYSWAETEYPNLDATGTLLAEMVYEGKLLYFTEAMCPDLPDSVIIGFTKSQDKWCKKNEGGMWTYWAEHKLLYSTERLDLQRYIGDGPFTNVFTQESPARTGVWVGWQIVRSYMNTHPEVSLEALMLHDNAQELLSQSGYFPD